MYGRIIVGYDGSPNAEDALRLGALLAKATGARLLIGYIYQAQPEWHGRDSEYRRELRDKVQAIFERARNSLPEGISVDTESFASSVPAQGLKDLARSERDALLVLGPTHHGPIGRVVIGSVGEQLLEGAPCSVTVAPKDFHRRDDESLDTLGVAFDGSPESEVALRHGHELASVLEAELRALAVVKKGSKEEGKLKQALESAGKDVGAPAAELSALKGDPAKALSKAAEELDLLITGSRGRGPVGGAVLGSVSAKLMRNAPCPVLIVPRGVSAPAAERQARPAAQ
jgi:nucleotide-binding universal stress UspA family protein